MFERAEPVISRRRQQTAVWTGTTVGPFRGSGRWHVSREERGTGETLPGGPRRAQIAPAAHQPDRVVQVATQRGVKPVEQAVRGVQESECVLVFPSVKKLAIGLGASYGRGALICRGGANYTGPWGAPVMYALEGGNIGFQLGAQATDFVILVMNPKGATSVLSSKVKLGADASAAAGPKGRTASASTDVVMKAELLSYSRSRGLFAGVSLEGSTLRSDGGANKNLYGKEVDAKDIIVGKAVRTPAAGQTLITILNKKSPQNRSDTK